MFRIFAPLLTLLLIATPALADCADDVCATLQRILQERSSNFAKIKGRPSTAPKGDLGWEGLQPVPGLFNYCFVYARGGESPYEYRCDASGLDGAGWLSVDQARQIAEAVKTAFQSADAKLTWFIDGDSFALSKIAGFESSQAWYGGPAADRLIVKVSVFGSDATGTSVSLIVFAKPLSGADVR